MFEKPHDSSQEYFEQKDLLEKDDGIGEAMSYDGT
jgi:hypothetical protein